MAKKKLKKVEVDIRIGKIINGYIVKQYDEDYNETVKYFTTRDEVVEYIDELEF